LGEAFQFDWSDEGMVVGGIFYKLQVARFGGNHAATDTGAAGQHQPL